MPLFKGQMGAKLVLMKSLGRRGQLGGRSEKGLQLQQPQRRPLNVFYVVSRSPEKSGLVFGECFDLQCKAGVTCFQRSLGKNKQNAATLIQDDPDKFRDTVLPLSGKACVSARERTRERKNFSRRSRTCGLH